MQKKNQFQNTVCKMAAIFCRPPYFNSSPPGQNGRHFADDIYGFIFVNEEFYILIKILSLFIRVQLTITQHWFR